MVETSLGRNFILSEEPTTAKQAVVVLCFGDFILDYTCWYLDNNDAWVFSNMFVDFPFGCQNFKGPHPLQCYRSIWKKIGCIEEGLQFPYLLDILMGKEYYYWNIKYCIMSFFLNFFCSKLVGLIFRKFLWKPCGEK